MENSIIYSKAYLYAYQKAYPLTYQKTYHFAFQKLKILKIPHKKNLALVNFNNNTLNLENSKDLMAITKFKLAVMNTFSGLVPFIYYNPISLANIGPYFLFTFGTLFISSASQVLNQLTEKEKDKMMIRTSNRPLVQGGYSDEETKRLVAKLMLFSSACYLPLYFYNMFPIKTMILSYAIMGLYNFVYTPLKKHSNLSMHVGALVGALVPFLGSIASTGLLYDQISVILGIFIFAWQYPHFYGIVYRHRQCYTNANFEFISKYPMNDKKAIYQIFVALIVMAMCGIKLYSLGKINFPLLGVFLSSMYPLFKTLPQFITYPKKTIISSYLPYLIFTVGIIYAGLKNNEKEN